MFSSTNKYIRDGRAPVPKNENISRVMSANKSTNTKPELLLRKALWQNNIKGYRLHWKKVPGKPDIAFPGRKVAIFVNGCFWHRCPICNPPLPKSNVYFWENKFRNNNDRDRNKIQALSDLGWKVITIWECQINQNIITQIDRIKITLNNKTMI